jgi:carboxyl-terminal processing protease
MKLKWITILTFVLITAVASSFFLSDKVLDQVDPDAIANTPTEEDTLKNKVLLQVLNESLGAAHYQPLSIDDDFSEKVFDLYIERLDFNKRLFTASDIKELEKYKHLIDDQIKSRNYGFFDVSYDILVKRLEDSRKFYKEILAEKFDFKTNETIELDGDKREYPADNKALKEVWRKALKYQTMTRINSQLDIQETAKEEKDTSVTIKTFAELEEEAREKVLKNFDDYYSRIDKLNKEDRRAIYLNSFANVFGPHTTYFPPRDKENFDISMSGQLEGIGARLQEKEGYIKVASIVPGSASARQGELAVNDAIHKVAQGDEDPVDIVGMRIDDAVQLIRGKKGTIVKLTVKKVDGTTKVIPIERDIVVIEETYAKSILIENGTKGGPVGYIDLPSFYADFNKVGGRRCAADVKEEVEKLKAEGAKGIVLDLRNNGGGSLYDVVEMAGLFIENGPIVQVKAKGKQPEVLNDYDAEINYDGPLVVMVNSFSASASEIMAAAIQDYGRGVVIGSNSSFGKGTVQRFVELDRLLTPDNRDAGPLGALKITLQKFYRINGGATQLKGVVPDVVIPDLYAYMETGEKEHDFVMEWDKIEPATYNKWEAKYDIAKIEEKSHSRINSNSLFKSIDDNAKRMKERSDKSSYSLNFEGYRKDMKAWEEESEKFSDMLDKDIEGVSITTLKADMKHLKADTVKMKRHETWKDNLKKDLYVNEAISVILDMESTK